MNQVNEILAKIGTAGRNKDGSYTRRCYSPEYFMAVDIVEDQMNEMGMETERDAAGNIHGILRGTDPVRKSILMDRIWIRYPKGDCLTVPMALPPDWRLSDG